MVKRGKPVRRKVIDRRPVFGRLQNKRGQGIGATIEITLRMSGMRAGKYVASLEYTKDSWRVISNLHGKQFGHRVINDAVRDARHLFPHG